MICCTSMTARFLLLDDCVLRQALASVPSSERGGRLSDSMNAKRAGGRSKALAYIGVSVALIALSSVIAIPLGPIPVTLQMFAIPLLICILPASWSVASVYAFLLLGLVGLPVFSGFHSGIGAFLGPTGGYLIGYIPGVAAGALMVRFAKGFYADGHIMRFWLLASEVVAGMLFTAIAYLVGWVWYANVAGVGLEAAFVATVAPFALLDALKVVVAVSCAQPVSAAVRLSR